MSLLRPRFLKTPAGQLFLQCWLPEGLPSATLLVLPPFAEEMNKCRPQIAALGRQLAASGRALLLPDWYGTGDSDGEFCEATLDQWRQDLQAVLDWTREKGLTVTTLLGVRFGALLGTEVLPHLADVRHLLLWQPVLAGETLLTQLLRTRVAAALMNEAASKETVSDLLGQLAAGQAVEAGGYEISPALAAGLRGLNVPEGLPPGTRVGWLDMVGSEETPVSRAAARLIGSWQSAGTRLSHRRLVGEPYWTSTEISVSQPLVDATLECLDG